MRFKLYRTLITSCIFTDEETNAASVRIVTINTLRRKHSETDSKSGSQKLKKKNRVHPIGQKFCIKNVKSLVFAGTKGYY